MAQTATDLGGGVWQFQTSLWQTNSVLVARDGEVLVCDPCWTPKEIEAMRARAKAAGGPVRLLITHGDYDHICGIGSFPDAEVLSGPETAARVAEGSAGRALEAAGEEWGLSWPGAPRVDRVVPLGEPIQHGPFRLWAIDARGHVADGVAWALVDDGLLLAGDYLSPMTYPFVNDSVERCRATHERLLAAIDEHGVTRVVPGHGAVVDSDEARRIGAADASYLEALQVAAREAAERALPPGPALLHVFEVEPPRPTTLDFEVFALRAWNARAALAEVAGQSA